MIARPNDRTDRFPRLSDADAFSPRRATVLRDFTKGQRRTPHEYLQRCQKIASAMHYLAADPPFDFGSFFCNPDAIESYHCFAWYEKKLRKSAVSSISDAERREKIKLDKGKPYAAVNLTVHEIMAIHKKQAYRCALSLKPFYGGNCPNGLGPNSPSLDRIDHDGPYSTENVRVVLFCLNAARGRQSDTELRDTAKAFLANTRRGGRALGPKSRSNGRLMWRPVMPR